MTTMLSPGYQENVIVHEIVVTDKIPLVDADNFKYLITDRISKEVNVIAHKTPKEDIDRLIEEHIERLFRGLKCLSQPIYIFGGKTQDTFRFACAREKEYKGNRKGRDLLYLNEPLDKAYIVNYMKRNYHVLQFDDLEADDVIAMLMSSETFCISDDKDMMQLPGYHYDRHNWKLFWLDPREAWRNLMYQMLIGDPTDNIGGIYGIGEKHEMFKPEGAFNKTGDDKLHAFVLNEYVKKYGIRRGTDRFVEMFNLLRLVFNRGDYNKAKYKKAFDLVETLKIINLKNHE